MSPMSPTGLHLNKPVVSLLICVIIGGVVWFNIHGKSPTLAASPDRAALPDRAASPDGAAPPIPAASPHLSNVVEEVKLWKTREAPEIPSDKVLDIENDKCTKNKTMVTVGDQSMTVIYRENSITAPKLDVLLLHGAFFKSENWVSTPLWTLQLLARMGYRGVAIDLPGYGETPPASPSQAEFLEALIEELELDSPIIVSPSMSGSYALPYLFKDPVNILSRSKGFVALAPVGTDGYSAEQYRALKIPTLVIYGEKDLKIGATANANLKMLPNHVIVKLKEAGHSCYFDNPNAFHKHLIHFLESLEDSDY